MAHPWLTLMGGFHADLVGLSKDARALQEGRLHSLKTALGRLNKVWAPSAGDAAVGRVHDAVAERELSRVMELEQASLSLLATHSANNSGSSVRICSTQNIRNVLGTIAQCNGVVVPPAVTLDHLFEWISSKDMSGELFSQCARCDAHVMYLYVMN